MPKRAYGGADYSGRKRMRTVSAYMYPRKRSQKSSVAKLVKSIFHPEVKYLDYALTLQSVASNGTVVCVNSMAEGSDFNQRTGRSITPLYLCWDISLFSPTLLGSTDFGQMGFVCDNSSNAVLPSFATIFSATVTGYGSCFLNKAQFKDRFVVLSKHFVGPYEPAYATAVPFLNTNGGSGTGSVLSTQSVGTYNPRYRGFLNLKKMKCMQKCNFFDGTAAYPPSVGGLYLFAGSQANTGSSSTQYNFVGAIRFAWIDV